MNEEHIYGKEVIPFVQSQLSLGKSLSKYVLEKKDLATAKAHAYLPASSTPEMRGRFHCGILDEFEYESKPQVIDYLTNQMMVLQDSVAIFDDWLSKPSESHFLYKKEIDFLTHFDEVYLYVSKENYRQLYRKGISPTSSYPSIGVITHSPHTRDFYPGIQVSEELFFELCRNISHLIIGAYDDETQIILSWL